MEELKRVVVTGMGVISPVGNSVREFCEALQTGKSGKNLIQGFDVAQFPIKYACEIKNFNSHRLGTHLMDPFIEYAVAAADEAIQDSGIKISETDPYRIGISVSSSKGGVHTIDRFKDRFQKNRSAILGARIYANSVPNFAAQWIARRWKIQGPAKCYIAACATGTVALIEGARMVADGTIDYCIAGSSDASVVPLMLAGYRNMKVMANEEIRPFHPARNGFLAGEGSGILILESLESAQKRGAKIYGEIAGHAYGCDSSDPLRFSDREHALSYTLSQFFKRNEISPFELGYINLHGTATQEGDRYETREVKRSLGERAYQIPMSSTKSMTGHMLGAAGSVEAIACLLSLNQDFLPPTIHLDQQDADCDLDYVPQTARKAKIDLAVSLSMGFGGHIAILGLRKFSGRNSA